MTTPATTESAGNDSSAPRLHEHAGVEAERNSALTIGVLHFFVVFAAPALLWNSDTVGRTELLIWTGAEVCLGLFAFFAFGLIGRGRFDAFIRLSRVESRGTAATFSALAWLGDDIATATPSKHVLMIALIAVTSVSASNSSHITRRRPFFGQLIVIVATSYTVAFAIHGEWVFAILTVLWCISIRTLTRVGYHSMLELVELRKASENTARHDDLTGLLSRSAFFDELNYSAASSRAQRHPTEIHPALVLFDLDGFKAINDSFGHAAGDAVLQAVAKRLTLFLPKDSAIGRLGGDEFAAVVTAAPADVSDAIDAGLAAVAEPIHIGGRELYVAASAGWTFVDAAEVSAELMAQADAAMYQSKNSETDIATGFDAALRDELDRSLDLRQRVRTALRRKEIEFWVQPIVRTSDASPVAVELLARWPQQDSTMIGPMEFTRVADETGLAVELDRQALTAARDLLVEWADDPLLGTLLVKANISPVHLHNDELLQTVRGHIPVPMRNRLGLEFVESRLIAAAGKNHSQLRDLMGMGITLSIDDFGVGYSSLTYLRSLPVSEIKIDRSFVTDVDTDAINQGLVRAIVDIASTLGLPTVAEGIETEAEFAAITRLGVSLGQGYFLGHPLPVSEAPFALRNLAASAISLRD